MDMRFTEINNFWKLTLHKEIDFAQKNINIFY